MRKCFGVPLNTCCCFPSPSPSLSLSDCTLIQIAELVMRRIPVCAVVTSVLSLRHTTHGNTNATSTSRKVKPAQLDDEYDSLVFSEDDQRSGIRVEVSSLTPEARHYFSENQWKGEGNVGNSWRRTPPSEALNTGAAVDPKRGEESEDSDPDNAQLELSASELERQRELYEGPPALVVEYAVHYLNATTDIQMVSAREEMVFFPVLFDRLQELHVDEILDVVECHWARSTLLRYGLAFKDVARDRIAQLATEAALQLRNPRHQRDAPDEINHDEEGNGADGGVFVGEREQQSSGREDAVLTHALKEITAETTKRSILVMGISAGRRKRDLQFFQLMGSFFAFYINEYRDPNDLVRTLTALNRAKIRPSQKFLGLITRRLPILCKKTPLEPLACYRIMINLSRMGCDQMSIYRFLSDSIFSQMEDKINAVRKEEKMRAKLGKSSPSSPLPGASATLPGQETEAERLRARLVYLTGMKASMFTKWLGVLARFGAPHQQYLRPLISPVILPCLSQLPPPSLSRLIKAFRRFKSTDVDLLEALINHVCLEQAPAHKAERIDLVHLLQLVSNDDMPLPSNLDTLITTSCQLFTAALALDDPPAAEASGRSHGTAFPFLLRPADMHRIAHCVVKLQRRADIELERLEPLEVLMDRFAHRLDKLMSFGVVSLVHVDVFLDTMALQHHPDRDGRVAALSKRRREVAADEEAYESMLDIDVRETFYNLLSINDAVPASHYRPVRGDLQVDFRQSLTEVSAFDLLEAVDIFQRVSPGALCDTPKRFLSRSVIAKLGGRGEEVVESETNTLVMRKPRELLLRREDVTKMVELVKRTPLESVRDSPVVWQFLLTKASNLGLEEVKSEIQQCQSKLSHKSVS